MRRWRSIRLIILGSHTDYSAVQLNKRHIIHHRVLSVSSICHLFLFIFLSSFFQSPRSTTSRKDVDGVGFQSPDYPRATTLGASLTRLRATRSGRGVSVRSGCSTFSPSFLSFAFVLLPFTVRRTGELVVREEVFEGDAVAESNFNPVLPLDGVQVVPFGTEDHRDLFGVA